MRNIFLIFTAILLFSCTKTEEKVNFLSAESFFPIHVGKSLLYRMDSTVLIQSGKTRVVHSYIIKDSIESSFYDATGNLSYRIFRYITDTLQQTGWSYSATNIATIKNGNIEVIEDNLRFIKLANPVSDNFSWKGNIYINTVAPSPYEYYDRWDYRYTDINKSFTAIKGKIDSTCTVLQTDDGKPFEFDKNFFYQKLFSKEVYGKNIGLIYKDISYFTWQPGDQRFEDNSFGVRLNLIDYK